jgi:hypothetical protein
MGVETEHVKGRGRRPDSSGVDSVDFDFVPKSLVEQCRRLIESFHELHGYLCLPDMLWKARLGPFIETHHEFRALLKKASTTRSAKKSNEGFVRIATSLLSIEVLASHFAGWSAIYPQAAKKAQAILARHASGYHMPLMEFYLHPPKYRNSAAIATLSPPPRTVDHPEGRLDSAHVPTTLDGMENGSGLTF